MNRNMKIKSYIITFFVIYIYSYIFFNNIFVSIGLGLIISVRMSDIIYEYFTRNDLKNRRIYFREFLDILNSNIISGQNLYQSLKASSDELKIIFPDNSPIVVYVGNIVESIDNGQKIEEALRDFEYSMGLEEVSIFVDSLVLGIESGINISTITQNSKDMLTENIGLELELATIADNSKKEFLIMCILPLFVLILVNANNSIGMTRIDYLVRIPIFFLFIFSFYIGNKIVNREL